MKARALCLLLPLVTTIIGCKGSVKAKASADANGNASAEMAGSGDGEDEDVPDFDMPMEPSEGSPLADEGALPPGTEAPIGARQDLMFKGPGTLTCRCMSVALGPATSQAFSWSGTPPRTNPNTQFVIGFSSTRCQGAPEDARASYWGFEVSGDDVVVVVENSHEGRPVTVGAIIPKPYGDGQVYLRPLDGTVPFARGEGGRCKLGNPGAKRTGAAETNSGVPQGGVRIR